MKRIHLMLMVGALAALSITSALAEPPLPGIGRDQTLSAQPKATTIAELVARYNSDSCIECHEDTHAEWAESAHSRSIFGTGRTALTFRTAIINGLMDWPYSGVEKPEDVRVAHLMGCAKCHLPQLADATDDVAREIVVKINAWRTAMIEEEDDTADELAETLSSLNINCLICHNRNAITHKWKDGYPQRDTVYGVDVDDEHESEDFPKVRPSPIMTESIMCGQCHGQGPNLELDEPTQCATAYGSYLFAYIPEGGHKTCQQCHMEESGLGHNIQSYRSEAMSDQAVKMEFDAQAMVWRDVSTMRPKVAVRVDLTNLAGHGIPDG